MAVCDNEFLCCDRRVAEFWFLRLSHDLQILQVCIIKCDRVIIWAPSIGTVRNWCAAFKGNPCNCLTDDLVTG